MARDELVEPMEVDNAVGEVAGTISKIRVENFMCHANMEVNLIDRVNFITGENGSGKSAILTALCVAFGSNAKGTSRACTLKDFIKHGCSYALVVVEVRNTGDDAFKPDTYGNKIIVERRITESTSTFTLKDSTGKKAGGGKVDVDELVDHFNIDTDNPCTIMTQEKSRDFLHSGNDREKFQFFYKATQLEAVVEALDNAQALVQKAEQLGNECLQGLEPFARQVEDLGRQVQEMQKVLRYQEEIAALEKQKAWVQTFELDKQVDKAETNVKKVDTKIQKSEQHIVDYQQTLASATERKEAAALELSELMKQVDEVKAKAAELQRQLEQKTIEKAGIEANLNSKKRSRANAMKEMENVQKIKEEAQQRLLQDSQAECSRTQEMICTKKSQIEAAKEEEQHCQSQVQQLEGERNEAVRFANSLKEKVEQRKRDHADMQRHVNRMKQDASSTSSLFMNERVKGLLHEVEQKRSQFGQPPIGPIGAHVRLLDDKWALAVELVCGQLLDAFIVDSFRDMEILKECARNARMGDVRIFIYNYQNARYNVPPLHGYQTIKANLAFDQHHIIENVLVDQASIERIALADDASEGQMIGYGSRWQPAIKECIDRDGGRFYKRQSTTVSLPLPYPVRPRLSKNQQELIVEQERKLHEMTVALSQVTQEKSEADARAKAAEGAFRQAKGRMDAVNHILFGLSKDLEHLMKELADANNNNHEQGMSGDNAMELELQIRELSREVEDSLGPISALEEQLSDANEQMEMVKKEFDSNKVRGDRLEKGLGDAQEKLQRLEEEKQGTLHKIDYYQKLIAGELATEKGQAEEAVGKAKEQRQAAADRASEFCSEEEAREAMGPTPKTQVQITRDIRRLMEVVAKEEERQGNQSLEELVGRYQRMCARKEMREANIKRLTDRTGSMLALLKVRRKKLRGHVKHLTDELWFRFNSNLQKKGFEGDIDVNYKDKTLSMEVRFPDQGGASVTDTRALSGGERSFTTLAYAMALHDMTTTPFRAMDEFDIFMDTVTRKLSLKSVVEHALGQGGGGGDAKERSQWIFITPHDISSVDAVEGQVTKQAMQAPRD